MKFQKARNKLPTTYAQSDAELLYAAYRHSHILFTFLSKIESTVEFFLTAQKVSTV